MKRFSGPTDFWQFPIMGEETWAGVNVALDMHGSFTSDTGIIHHHRRSHHGTPTQQFTQFTQSHP